jgi:hypothetical protein
MRPLGGAFAGGPELIDGAQRTMETVGRQRLELGHRRIDVGHGEFGGDEPPPRLESTTKSVSPSSPAPVSPSSSSGCCRH